VNVFVDLQMESVAAPFLSCYKQCEAIEFHFMDEKGVEMMRAVAQVQQLEAFSAKKSES